MKTRMPFGKFSGWLITELPDDYLDWLLTIELPARFRPALQQEWQHRFGVDESSRKTTCGPIIRLKPEELALARCVFDAGYKAVARKLHPDHGGDVEAMQRLNGLRDSLRDQFENLIDERDAA